MPESFCHISPKLNNSWRALISGNLMEPAGSTWWCLFLPLDIWGWGFVKRPRMDGFPGAEMGAVLRHCLEHWLCNALTKPLPFPHLSLILTSNCKYSVFHYDPQRGEAAQYVHRGIRWAIWAFEVPKCREQHNLHLLRVGNEGNAKELHLTALAIRTPASNSPSPLCFKRLSRKVASPRAQEGCF